MPLSPTSNRHVTYGTIGSDLVQQEKSLSGKTKIIENGC